jgi:hypothetical protein
MYQYILEKGSKKFHCPNCQKKRFVRYIDTSTNEYLPYEYGICDRIENCGYISNPYKDGFHIGKENIQFVKSIPQKTKPLTPFSKEMYLRTLKGYENNNFLNNLMQRVIYPFNPADIETIISLYGLGTIERGNLKGALTIPFIDENNVIRAVQVKQFDDENHTILTTFLHSIIERHFNKVNKNLPQWLIDYNNNETKVSCLFGEHLLNKYPNNPIALVEAPKTAIYGTLYFGNPNNENNLLWLAVYNLSSLNSRKCKPLRNRKVILFPDLSIEGKAFNLWSERATRIAKDVEGIQISISDLLEKEGTEQDRKEGKDLADYLIKLDWRKFKGYQWNEAFQLWENEHGYPEDWDN